MRKHIQFWACTASLAMLAACGGGSDGETVTPSTPPPSTVTAAVDKYLGSWATGCEWLRLPGVDPAHPNGLSEIEVITFTKVADDELSGAGVETAYSSTDCSGPVTAVTNYALTVTLTGSVTVAADVADKLVIAQEGDLQKILALVNGERLYFGTATPIDADGYPTTIDTSWYLTKQ